MENSRSPRICLVPGTLAGGGIGTVTLTLAQALHEAGAAVDVLTIEREGATERRPPPGVGHVALAPRTRSALFPAVTYLRRIRPDLIVSARDYAHLIMLAAHRLAGQPGRLVWHLHNHVSSDLAAAGPVRRQLGRTVLQLAQKPDALVGVSAGVSAGFEAAAGLRTGTVRTIPNPAWTSAHTGRAARQSRHPWLTRPRPVPVILGVGRLVPQKDFATLIEAVARLRRRRPVRLILLGEGPLRGELEALVQRRGLAGEVDLPGHVGDTLPFFAAANLFALSSAWEGLPTALIEAMGCGCPVVATDCASGPAEILADNEGPLVAPGDPDALARAMEATLDLPPDPVRLRAAAARYDATGVAQTWLDLIERG